MVWRPAFWGFRREGQRKGARKESGVSGIVGKGLIGEDLEGVGVSEA